MPMSTGGLPLLSGPPPEYLANEQSCRKCDKEFNILFARSRKCNHCGYLYCHSCTDFQALLRRSGNESGYDVVPVCTFCIDNLTITAGGKGHLRSLPLSRLKKYASAYNIKTSGVFEKDDLIDALISARDSNGCLPRANEDFYRKHSVPNRRSRRPRGIFTRAMDAMGSERPPNQPQPQRQPPSQPRQRTTSGPSSFPRPDLDARRQQQPPSQQRTYQRAPPPPPSGPSRPQAPPLRPAYPPSTGSPHLNVPGNSADARGRARAASASSSPRQASPAPPVPTLAELLQMSEEQLARLSIGALKAVLFQNHVNARLVVEKEELVAKVRTLVEEERRERARHEMELEEERLAEEDARMQRDEELRRQAERNESEAQAREDAQQETIVGQEATRGDDTQAGAENDAMEVDAPAVTADGIHNSAHDIQGETQTHEGASDESVPPPLPPKASAAPASASDLSPKAQVMASRLERTGLCVICQDEEANIAIVDCGHLCLCRPCSELIMKGSRECPLCRTRIVTEQRLLRIFRT